MPFFHDLRGEGTNLIHFLLAALGAHEVLQFLERGFSGIDLTSQGDQRHEALLLPLFAHGRQPFDRRAALWIFGVRQSFLE